MFAHALQVASRRRADPLPLTWCTLAKICSQDIALPPLAFQRGGRAEHCRPVPVSWAHPIMSALIARGTSVSIRATGRQSWKHSQTTTGKSYAKILATLAPVPCWNDAVVHSATRLQRLDTGPPPRAPECLRGAERGKALRHPLACLRYFAAAKAP